MKSRGIITLLIAAGLSAGTFAQSTGLLSTVPDYIVTETPSASDFVITSNVFCADIIVSENDQPGVARAAGDLSLDIQRVSGKKPDVLSKRIGEKGNIYIGTIGSSAIIDELIEKNVINVSDVRGKWEACLIQVVNGNLVIAGSDRRGTIYGIYDVSEKIGVSPWYWFADVPAEQHADLAVRNGRYVQDSPKVKYRGIFINDCEPSFGTWSKNNFGGINSKMYSHIFELILRLKANYFWPAMWGKAFNTDDPLNPVVANEYGVIMGTSHHEPMMRSQKEYDDIKAEVGPWDYAVNPERLNKFFEDGIVASKDHDNLITIGMRGEGDVAMAGSTDEDNMKTLADVVRNQREIISRIHGTDASNVPQMWAVFTEVQRYYDKGFEIPDDVVLMFCDNNWGYIRRTGPEKEQARSGGMGMYYHIDMNGGPWNDRWINTTTIPKLREQMNLAYQTGIDDLWIINVGDLKPKEFPIDFLMRYAWNPDRIGADQCMDYTREWCAEVFGEEYADECAYILSRYPKYNLWRKPEAQVTGIMSVVNYQETDRINALWEDLETRCDSLKKIMPAHLQDAFYQLIYYPAVASAGVARIYGYATAQNLYAKQGRIGTATRYAQLIDSLVARDKMLEDFYNNELAGGKWKGMMQDIHMGYTQWSMPRRSVPPATVGVTPQEGSAMGIAVEGSESEGSAQLPVFDNMHPSETHFIDIFNLGNQKFTYQLKSSHKWLRVSSVKGTVLDQDARIEVSVNWKKLRKNGTYSAQITIQGAGKSDTVWVKAVKGELPEINDTYFGNHTGGEFSIQAIHFNRMNRSDDASWTVLPDLGRGEGCMGIDNVRAASVDRPDATTPYLEYNVYLSEPGEQTVCIGIKPTQDINPARGLRIAAGIDESSPVILDARRGLVDTFNEYTPSNLANSPNLKALPAKNRSIKLVGNGNRRTEVFDDLRWLDCKLDVTEPGIHRLRIYMVDPEVVLEQITINPDNEHPSYFGAPESETN